VATAGDRIPPAPSSTWYVPRTRGFGWDELTSMFATLAIPLEQVLCPTQLRSFESAAVHLSRGGHCGDAFRDPDLAWAPAHRASGLCHVRRCQRRIRRARAGRPGRDL